MSQRCGNCHHLLTTISGLKPGLGYCAWYEHQPATNRVFPDWIMDALGVVRLDEGTGCLAWKAASGPTLTRPAVRKPEAEKRPAPPLKLPR